MFDLFLIVGGDVIWHQAIGQVLVDPLPEIEEKKVYLKIDEQHRMVIYGKIANGQLIELDSYPATRYKITGDFILHITADSQLVIKRV